MLLHDIPWWVVGFAVFIIAMGITGAAFAWWYAVIMVMLALVIIPFVMWIPYIHYGFKQLTASNVALHTLSLEDGRLTITFPDTERSFVVDPKDFKGYKVMPGGVLVPSKAKDKGWLWLETSAFESPEEMQAFLKALYTGRENET